MSIDFNKLEDAPHLLDLLVSMEDVLDSLDLYVFENWLQGEVIEGPLVRRHWMSMALLYPHDKKPNVNSAARLIKHGVKVEFNQVQREPDKDSKKNMTKDTEENLSFWRVKLTFPRRLLGEINPTDIDMYEDDVDEEDLENAKDSGMDDESGYINPGESGKQPAAPAEADASENTISDEGTR